MSLRKLFGLRPRLPKWATYNKRNNFVEVEPGVVYPMYLEKLGYRATQNSLEIARFCFTEDLYQIVGSGLCLRILKDDRWKLSNYEVGMPLNFRTEYKRIKE